MQRHRSSQNYQYKSYKTITDHYLEPFIHLQRDPQTYLKLYLNLESCTIDKQQTSVGRKPLLRNREKYDFNWRPASTVTR